MEIKEIKEMIELMNENNLSELELEKNGLKIRLKKGLSGAAREVPIEEISVIPASLAHGGNGHKEPAAKPVEVVSQKIMIKSPMVGTFYAAPAPDAASFVQTGSQVEVGQVVCIIEAMKLMNEIKSEIRGKVVEILVSNGDPVEFGQPLFLVE